MADAVCNHPPAWPSTTEPRTTMKNSTKQTKTTHPDIPRAEICALAREVLRLGGHTRRPRGAFVARLIGKLLGEDALHLDAELAGTGYFLRRTNQIIINPKRADGAFTMAHELGHWAIAHFRPMWDSPAVPYVVNERAANAFAAALLGRKAGGS